MWPNEETSESTTELDDEKERDNVFAPIDGPFRPIPYMQPLVIADERKELDGKSQIELCRMKLEECKGYDVA